MIALALALIILGLAQDLDVLRNGDDITAAAHRSSSWSPSWPASATPSWPCRRRPRSRRSCPRTCAAASSASSTCSSAWPPSCPSSSSGPLADVVSAAAVIVRLALHRRRGRRPLDRLRAPARDRLGAAGEHRAGRPDDHHDRVVDAEPTRPAALHPRGRLAERPIHMIASPRRARPGRPGPGAPPPTRRLSDARTPWPSRAPPPAEPAARRRHLHGRHDRHAARPDHRRRRARARGAATSSRGCPASPSSPSVEAIDWGLVPASHLRFAQLLEIGRLIARRPRDAPTSTAWSSCRGPTSSRRRPSPGTSSTRATTPVVVVGAMRNAGRPGLRRAAQPARRRARGG